MFKRQQDTRSEPVSRIVALGESTTWGYSVSSKDRCWVNRVVRLLEECQGQPIELHNKGIGSNVLTRECPAYEHSRKPSALERLDDDLINLKPDMVFLSYGLNDSRGGISLEVFQRAYQELVDRIREAIDPTIVILNTYYMHEVLYDHEIWGASNYEITDAFNELIAGFAVANDLILADIYSGEVGVDWIIDNDHCHPNDVGHMIVAHRVFEAVVRNCSFTACQIPEETRIKKFVETYGNGPD
ncbi:MAG: SGNH/GDSL hydrolase family protein [Planctomycetota bacterium]|jgi:lysophospholipase L1-like esterase|nr:SGNH/GDSL hydrolase family protein [Planctomycetota bacterium]